MFARLSSVRRRLFGDGTFTPRRVAGHALFLVTFVGAKAAALLGMLWLARIAEPSLYGALEVALAGGLIAAGVGLLGIPGGATRLALVLDKPDIVDLLAFSALCVCAPATLLAWVGLGVGWSTTVVIALAFCAPACAQLITTTYARIRGRRMMNSFVDPFATLAVLAICTCLLLTGSLNARAVSWAATGLSTVLIAAMAWSFWRTRTQDFRRKYAEALKISAPMLALAGVSIIVSSALRPVLGVMFPLEAVAAYALCYRLSAPIVLTHQVIGTAFFARVYQAHDAAFDKLAAGLVALWIVMALAALAVFDPIVRLGFPAYAPSIELMRPLFVVVQLQIMLWIVNALLEMRMGRHAVSGRAAIVGYSLFGVLGLGLAAWRPELLGAATVAFDVALALFAWGQLELLRRRGAPQPALAVMVGVATVVCVTVATTMGLFSAQASSF